MQLAKRKLGILLSMFNLRESCWGTSGVTLKKCATEGVWKKKLNILRGAENKLGSCGFNDAYDNSILFNEVSNNKTHFR